jgi:hypothetical protein
VGAPTGTHDARFRDIVLAQDRQLGPGRVDGLAAARDHIVDNIWGPTVFGAIVNWRGGENELKSYRGPSASGYAYAGYLLGPIAPAAGLTVTGFSAHDRDRGDAQASALFDVAANVSLEYATNWAAFLLGASFPYQYDGVKADSNGKPRNPWGFGPWVVAFGVAFAPF